MLYYLNYVDIWRILRNNSVVIWRMGSDSGRPDDSQSKGSKRVVTIVRPSNYARI